ncbi:MAG: CapA family protein [Agriterribacter sp.]
MKILFTGDLFLGGDLDKSFEPEAVPLDLFKEADKVIVNLESPLSSNDFFSKKGVLYASPESVKNLVDWNIAAVNLANNHIQDKGNDGIIETISLLHKNNIGSFGAGRDIYTASQPYYLNEKLCIIGYCQYAAPTLTIIQLADENNPGVNPLNVEKIMKDLASIPDDVKVILHFHWGQEHLWLPDHNIIKMARQLLRHPKVCLIVGMHPHRIQGYISEAGKKCFFCLGNFLFPNFYIAPPSILHYPSEKIEKTDITRQYHPVSKVTYKKWRLKNRVSYLVQYNAAINKSVLIPVVQSDNKPAIRTLAGIKKTSIFFFLRLLSFTYELPAGLYIPLQKLNIFISIKRWSLYNHFFTIRQDGMNPVWKKIKKRFNKKS